MLALVIVAGLIGFFYLVHAAIKADFAGSPDLELAGRLADCEAERDQLIADLQLAEINYHSCCKEVAEKADRVRQLECELHSTSYTLEILADKVRGVRQAVNVAGIDSILAALDARPTGNKSEGAQS